MYSTSPWRVGAIFLCWGQRCWVFLYIGWNHHNSRLGGHSGWCYGRFLCFAATFSREITNSAKKYRQNCIVKENIVISQQQIPPRFPFEQRTRAELRFYRDMDYTKNALDYTQITSPTLSSSTRLFVWLRTSWTTQRKNSSPISRKPTLTLFLQHGCCQRYCRWE